jgi:tetratricopeptide (TPR) repeat protein
MARLVKRELLVQEADERSPERGQYSFVQALIREVAYNTLSKKDRKKLHLAAARYFEALGSDEIAGALASHYLAAHSNSTAGAEGDALATQARIALRAAAARAAALASFDQATVFLGQALSVTTDPIDQVDILTAAAAAFLKTARYEESAERARRAIEIAKETNYPSGAARATFELGRALNNMYKMEELEALLVPAVDEYADLDAPITAQLKYLFAGVYIQSDPRKALALLDDALEVFERTGDSDMLIRSLTNRAIVLGVLGRNRERLGIMTAAGQLAAAEGLIERQASVTGNMASVMTSIDLTAAVETTRESIALARRAGMQGTVLLQLSNLGYAAFLSGEWHEGIAALEEGMSLDPEPADAIALLNNIAIFRTSMGEPVDDVLAEIERLGKGMSGPWRAFLLDPLANDALVHGDFERARDAFLEVPEYDPAQESEYVYRASRTELWMRDLERLKISLDRLLRAGGPGRFVEARREYVLGAIAGLEGRQSEALSRLQAALDGFRSVGAVWDSAMTGIDMAMLLDPKDPAVAELIDATRTTLTRLGAKPYLERLDATLAAKPTATRSPVERTATEAEVHTA